ncbi:PEP-CTERM sorting domain-containing protein [Methyloversatilis thermotolerans]|uniref:PEP-CTERM sorting domain-containing protein n=1 Tax=Methyloversatilis thermotolerans TaxID=1346290 RepID=UPI000368CF1E|nr:PEP-CTERM sorting domain-containing protein [Methyloversatilis thermotolerans]
MIKTKLIAAAVAFGMSGIAGASITGGSTNNTEFVFSAYDSVTGVGYTFDLADAGFDSLFGSNVRMNSLIGSTNTPSIVTTTLLATPESGIIFDYALPSFSEFAGQVNLTNLQWNLVSADTSGTKRIIQTVANAPTSTLDNAAIVSAVTQFDIYTGAVNGKGTNVGGVVTDDGYAITTVSDGAAYAGNLKGNFAGFGYQANGSLDDVLSLYVVSSTSTTSNTNAGRYAALTDADDMQVVAKVYMAEDGLYHLQIAVVPEPETYAMLLAGLGLLGFVARRKRAA